MFFPTPPVKPTIVTVPVASIHFILYSWPSTGVAGRVTAMLPLVLYMVTKWSSRPNCTLVVVTRVFFFCLPPVVVRRGVYAVLLWAAVIFAPPRILLYVQPTGIILVYPPMMHPYASAQLLLYPPTIDRAISPPLKQCYSNHHR